MEKFYIQPTKDEVKVCHQKTCMVARGKNAQILTMAFTFVLVCVGISMLAKS